MREHDAPIRGKSVEFVHCLFRGVGMMSDIDWALAQKTGSAKSKLVLLLLAQRSDGCGYVPDVRDAELAAVAEMPLDAFRRELAKLHTRQIVEFCPPPHFGYILVQAPDEPATNIVPFRRSAVAS